MNTMRITLFFLCLVGLLSSLTGCARPVNRVAEQQIMKKLPDLLGSASKYGVRVDGDPYNTSHGRLARVQINATDLTLPDGLILNHLYLDLHQVVYNLHSHKLVSVKSTTFTSTISDDVIELQILGELPSEYNITHLKIQLLPSNLLLITGERDTIGIKLPVKILCHLILLPDNRVLVDLTRLTVVGIPIDGSILHFLVGHVQKIISLSALSLPLEVNSFNTGNGTITLSGTINLTEWTSMEHGNIRNQ